MIDVYDGKIWKEFMIIEKSLFLNYRNNYVLMLNLDWFQLFEYVKYFIGVIYVVILNLLR